ncbi:MAG: sugar phosphate isomerase/epimerase [Clostridiaceae bacterium]|nr:sugar phosphate isomerase/epimerase [Clostridiaceae bacterium]
MKLGISSYCYHQLIVSGAMTQFDTIRKAKEMGFDVIEFSGFDVPEGQSKESFAERVREECARVGIEFGNYTINADFINGSGGNLEAEIERLKEEVKIAKILGAKGMRHDAAWGFKPGYKGPRGFDDALPVLAKGCKAVTGFAKELGIRTMVENHGYFCQDSDRMEKLVNNVNDENFGLLVDIGNFLCADEDPAKAVGKVAQYAFHVHVKDFHVKPGSGINPGTGWFRTRAGNYLRGAIIGHGEVPVLQCLELLKKTGYNGTVSMEFEGLEDPIKGISIGLENLKRFMASLS